MFKQNKYTKNFYIILFVLTFGLAFSLLPVSMDYGGDEKNYIKNFTQKKFHKDCLLLF